MRLEFGLRLAVHGPQHDHREQSKDDPPRPSMQQISHVYDDLLSVKSSAAGATEEFSARVPSAALSLRSPTTSREWDRSRRLNDWLPLAQIDEECSRYQPSEG